MNPKPTSELKGAAAIRSTGLVLPRASDIPLHPLVLPWRMNPPRDCHPAIRHIKNWREKVSMPWPRAARLKRKLAAATVKYWRSLTHEEAMERIKTKPRGHRLPEPLTNASANWSEGKHLRNASLSNMATVAATTYGLPIYNPATGFYVANPERNEFWDNHDLLKFLCVEGKMTKRDYARMKRQNDPSSATGLGGNATSQKEKHQ